jgi:antitoxin component YwqK of YwqJK toxin-antitoxin module
MKIYLPFILVAIALSSYGQGTEERVLFVVDSIEVVDDSNPEDGEIKETDVETLQVVTDKKEIEKYGYTDVDKIIFVITKEYFQRPADLKKIPTTKKMVKKEGNWTIKGATTPYSGQFINYFMNGKKQAEGVLKNGRMHGRMNSYYQDGSIRYYRDYAAGNENGESKEFFKNGKVHQEGNFKNGDEDGTWKEWYSTGQLKRQTEFKEGKVIPTKVETKFHNAFSKGIELFNAGNYSGAIRNYDKAIELNPNYSDVYFYRSRAYLNDLKFDKAMTDCNKAIELEPEYKEAYTIRAFIRLREHELKDTREINLKSGITVLAGKPGGDMPKETVEKLCADLNKALELGETNAQMLDVMKSYCK